MQRLAIHLLDVAARALITTLEAKSNVEIDPNGLSRQNTSQQ